MKTFKLGLEKPLLIWILLVVLYGGVFWSEAKIAPLSGAEQATYDVIQRFSENSFPPTIGLIREAPDWGHLAYYAIMGRVFRVFHGDEAKMRLFGLILMVGAFFVFIRLGSHFTYRNRLNPLWVSLAALILAANPYSWMAAFQINDMALLLFLLLAAMFFFEKEWLGWSSVLLSLAVLVDWRSLLLAVAFLISKLRGEQSRLIRPERIAAFLLPFFIAALPLIAWQGIVPQGDVREWLVLAREKTLLFRPDGIFYSLALLPVYGLIFSWAWGIRARTRALVLGAIWAAVFIPIYFIFPISSNAWLEAKHGLQVPLGLLDQAATLVAGPYKNLVLFVPWLTGSFLFFQLLLMDVLDRSRWLRYFIVSYFTVQPFLVAFGAATDQAFLMIVPAVLLLSLSEALVGEEGKLAS